MSNPSKWCKETSFWILGWSDQNLDSMFHESFNETLSQYYVLDQTLTISSKAQLVSRVSVGQVSYGNWHHHHLVDSSSGLIATLLHPQHYATSPTAWIISFPDFFFHENKDFPIIQSKFLQVFSLQFVS